jgi:hypothetical protein
LHISIMVIQLPSEQFSFCLAQDAQPILFFVASQACRRATSLSPIQRRNCRNHRNPLPPSRSAVSHSVLDLCLFCPFDLAFTAVDWRENYP